MVISKKQSPSDPFGRIVMGDHCVELKDRIMLVGYIFDSKMTWGPMIDMIAKKARIRVGALYRMRMMLSSENLQLIYIAFVRSILEYGSTEFMGAAQSHLQKLDRIQRRAERLGGFKLESLQSRREASVLSRAFKLLDGAGRGALQEQAPQLTSVAIHSKQTRRTSSNTGLRIMSDTKANSLDCYRRSASGALPTIWDKIPAEFKDIGMKKGWRRINKDTKEYLINLDISSETN